MINKEEACDMSNDLERDTPSVSYVDPGFHYGITTTSGTSMLEGLRAAPANAVYQWQPLGNPNVALTQIPRPQQEKQPVARLIRFTVVDPDPSRADKAAAHSILMTGTALLNGADDKAFLMDMAATFAEKLVAHNEHRRAIEYDVESEKGLTRRTLKPIKLSNLDVVIETLKTY